VKSNYYDNHTLIDVGEKLFMVKEQSNIINRDSFLKELPDWGRWQTGSCPTSSLSSLWLPIILEILNS